MDTEKFLDTLRNPDFVSALINSSSVDKLELLFLEHNIKINHDECVELFNMTNSIIKNDFYKKTDTDDLSLSNVTGGGLREASRAISRPFYYTTYGAGYAIGKIPIIGYTVYRSIKDAILGFHDSLDTE